MIQINKSKSQANLDVIPLFQLGHSVQSFPNLFHLKWIQKYFVKEYRGVYISHLIFLLLHKIAIQVFNQMLNQ